MRDMITPYAAAFSLRHDVTVGRLLQAQKYTRLRRHDAAIEATRR